MIQIINLTKIYKSKNKIECKALDNINLTLPDKGLIFIVGKSGSGKSTLLNMISGLDNITNGEIISDGNYLSKMTKDDFDKYLSTYIGFVFQDYRLIDDLTIKQNIELALNIAGEKGDIDAYLSAVDLKGYENRFPKELSGGQKQRVAIVRALIKKPEVILADEPTGNLDAKTTIQVLNILKEISKEKLVIVVSHNLSDAYKYGDRIIELSDGKVINDKSRRENYVNEFSLKDGVLNLPHHYDLNNQEISHILQNKKNIKQINQINGGFVNSNVELQQTKKIEFKTHQITKEKKKELFKLFFSRKIFSKFLAIFLASLIISVSYVMQAFANFDENQSLYYDLVYNEEDAIVLRKGYDSGVNSVPTTTQAVMVDDEDISAFKEVYKGENIYKLYNHTITLTNSSIDYGTVTLMDRNIQGYLLKETYGTLNCKEEFVKNSLYDGGEIEVICGDLYDKPYGSVITDYVADSIIASNPLKYPNYESVLGKYSVKSSYNHSYINAVIKTNYKEKHKDIIELIGKAILNPDLYNLSEITQNSSYQALTKQIRKYYGISYNFDENYEEAITDLEFRPYATLSFSYFGTNYYSSTYTIRPDLENKYNLKDDELIMYYTTYNKIFETEYTSKTINDFVPHKMTYTLYTSPKREKVAYTKEFTIVGLVSGISYVSTNTYKELAKKDIFCYSLYFDQVKGNEKLLDVAEDLIFILESNDTIGIASVARVVSIVSNFMVIVEVILLLCSLLYLSFYGVRTIKSNIYEIGVIKSQGGSDKDISSIFILQNFIVGIGVIVVSLIGMYVGSLLANSLLVTSFEEILLVKVGSFKIVQFYPSMVLIDLIAALVIILVSSILPVNFLKKVKPIDILKAKE